MRLREPLILPFALVALGVTLAAYHQFSATAAIAAAIAFCLLALFIEKPWWGGRSCRLPGCRHRRASYGAALCALASCGVALVAARPVAPLPSLSVPDNVPAIFDGCVVEPALLAIDRERFTVELAPGARAQVSLSAKPNQTFPELPYGTRIEFQGKVRHPHNYNNPGKFDVVHYLARQRIYWTASGDAANVHIQPGRCGNLALRAIFATRSTSLERLDRLYPSDPYSNGMMQAILIGANAKLDRMWTQDYRATGTFHALVISGGHVAVLAAVFLFLLRLCFIPRDLALLATVAMVWLYSGITGWQAPALRCAVGMTLYAIARAFYREGRVLNVLAAAAIAFVAVDPEQLTDASFQLSFLAVALIGAFVVPALAASSGPLARGLAGLDDPRKDIRLPPKSAQFRVEMRLLIGTLTLALRLPARAARGLVTVTARFCLWFWQIFVTSFFIQVGLALPMIVYFHRASVSGLTANAIVVPVLGAVVPLGFAAIALNSHPLASLCAGLLAVSRRAVGIHARWEPDWRIPAPPWWLAALFVLALIAAACALRLNWRRARPFAWVAVAAALAVIVVHPFAPAVERGKFELSAIDVGQGDSLLAAFPDGRLMLIDAGGIPSFGRLRKPGIDIGEDVVSPYLWTRSIKRLDVVVMTHAHEDHMGGMSAILKNFKPRELWAGAVAESPEWIGVRQTARDLGIPVRLLRRSDPFNWGGVTLHVLAPGPDYEADVTPKNDDSLVMRVQFGSTSFLLTGDMEKKIEEQLFYAGLLEPADVLKVGHHGSRTSSAPDLLDAVHPAFGIVSVGFENSYGHPHPLTIEALRQRHIAVLRTDEQGLIKVLSDGKTIHLN